MLSRKENRPPIPIFIYRRSYHMNKKVMISVIVLLLCIASTVGLNIAVDRSSTAYDEVTVVVVSAEEYQKEMLETQQTVYDVIVRYEGEEYKLKNVHSIYTYKPGWDTQAFLYGGQLYANVEGVKTATPLAIVYFVFLFASFAMLIVTAMVISRARRRA